MRGESTGLDTYMKQRLNEIAASAYGQALRDGAA
jgi:hypothetical protein